MTSTDTPARRSWLAGLARQRSVHYTLAGWVAANVAVLAAADDQLPFDWGRGTTDSLDRLGEANAVFVDVFLLIAVTFWLTRNRQLPDATERAPSRPLAARETGWLLAYGTAGLAGGALVGVALGWDPMSLHLTGTLFGTHAHVEQAEAIVWAIYNIVVFAVVPLVWFRQRGYSNDQLQLRSNNRSADLLLIVVVLTIETLFQITALDPEIFDLPADQLAVGIPLTFVLYMAGAVLPAMVFIFALLVPRFLRLTGSTTTTILLGGLTYAALHAWDAWTSFDSAADAVLSVAFLAFTYVGPGMVKTALTVRTANAWTHVWAYHAFAPHTLNDTPLIVDVFNIR